MTTSKVRRGVPSTWLLAGVLLMAALAFVDGAVDCTTATSCTSCTSMTGLTCGWCIGSKVSACRSGTAAKPADCLSWSFPQSQIISTVKSFPVNPTEATIYLRPGQALNLTVEVTMPESSQQPLDFYIMQDTSASMYDDVVTIGRLVPDMINQVLAFRKDTWFGLGTFIEKPLRPMGYANANNWVYKLTKPLAANYVDLQKAVANIVVQGNRDWCEAGLEAMVHAIVCASTGWRSNSLKVMVLVTDACAHVAGDTELDAAGECATDDGTAADYPGGSCTYSLPPNNLDCVLDILDPTKTPLSRPGSGEDYPSLEQLRSLLFKYNIQPVFAVHDTESTTANETAQWEGYRNALGVGSVHKLTGDSSDLLTAIAEALNSLSGVITLAEAGNSTFVRKITPAAGYTGVPSSQTRSFVVNFFTSKTVVPADVNLASLGFGNVIVHVKNLLPCLGCDGVVNSNKVVDPCGVCGGASACVDCAGVAFGTAVLDQCRVCAGRGNTCLDCMNVPFGASQYDKCGICNGQNLCLGCDGVARIPPYQVDLCGVCNGNNTCLDCSGTPKGTKKLDACGICGGDSSSCIGCDKKYSVPPKVVDSCGVCGGTDQCYDCLGKKNGTAVIDKCGICNGNDACKGCDGKYNVTHIAVVDACGVCDGTGSTCLGCDGLPHILAKDRPVFDSCLVCAGTNACLGCDGKPFSGLVLDTCGVCNGTNACLGCDGIANSGKVLDRCNVCGGTNNCLGCDNMPFSGKKVDVCGVCGGTGTSCLGCDKVPNSGVQLDRCGVCGGKNACVDCEEKLNGGKVFDDCGVCGGDNSCKGCDGIPGSKVVVDRCGVCGGNNTCVGCDDVPLSGAFIDACGVCNGINDCVGCDGIPYSGKVLDKCRVCGGNNTCLGCDGIPNSLSTFDRCGVCNGDDSSCVIDCLGRIRPPVPVVVDLCGVCNGTNQCLGCDGKPRSGAVLDLCGKCKGTNACLGCDGRPWSNLTVNDCGVCGSNITCAALDTTPLFLQPQTIVPIALAIGLTIAGVIAAVIAFIVYMRLRRGKDWLLPNAFAQGKGWGVEDNPIYKSAEPFKENPMYDHSL